MSLVSLSLWAARKVTKTLLRIGVALSLTGDGADYGRRSLNGIKWANEKINSQGGIDGKKIQLIVEDTKSSPRDAVSSINKLINVDKVRLIIGDIISGTTLAMAPIAEANAVVLLAPGASNPKLRESGDFIFRNWTSDDFDGKAIANYAYKNGVREVGLVVQKTDYTEGLANAFTSEFTRLGGSIKVKEEFLTDNRNLRAQITRMAAASVRAVYISAYSEGTGYILKQSAELGFSPQWFSCLTVDTPVCQEIAGTLRNGVIFSTPAFNPDDTSHIMQEFVVGFNQEFNDEPETSSGHGYDALRILAQVIRKVGTDPIAVKNELYNVAAFPGVTGMTTFDSKGDVLKSIFIKKFINGVAEILEIFTLS